MIELAVLLSWADSMELASLLTKQTEYFQPREASRLEAAHPEVSERVCIQGMYFIIIPFKDARPMHIDMC